MSSNVLTRHIGYLRSILPASRLSYHAGNAASVNTAIARSIRKSRGSGRRHNIDDARSPFVQRNDVNSGDREFNRGSREDRPYNNGRGRGSGFGGERGATGRAPRDREFNSGSREDRPYNNSRGRGSGFRPQRGGGSGFGGERGATGRGPRDREFNSGSREDRPYSNGRGWEDRPYNNSRGRGSGFRPQRGGGSGFGGERGATGRAPRDREFNSGSREDRPYSNGRGWEDRPYNNSRGGGSGFGGERGATRPFDKSSTTTDMKIHRGIKLVKTDEELARKKPNPAGPRSQSQFLYGKQGSPRTPFDEERGSGSFMRKAGRNPFESEDTPKFNPRHPHHFHNPQPREPVPESYGERRRRASSSNDDSTYKRKPWEPRSMEIAEGLTYFKPGENSLGNVRSVRRDWGPKGKIGLTEGLDPDDAPSTYEVARPYKQNNPAAQRGIDHNNSAEDGNIFTMTRREPHDTDFPVARIDPRFPVSIPYTTPASEFLYGTSVVQAALTSRKVPRRQLYKLYIYQGENRKGSSSRRDIDLEALARANNVLVSHVKSSDGLRLMDKMSSGRPHNGYVLEASPLPRLPITGLGSVVNGDGRNGFNVTVDIQSREDAVVNGTANFISLPKSASGRNPMVLLLDSIQDPGNLGGIIRTASFLGVSAVAISTRNTASFTPVVLKASAGASENITLFSVSNPEAFVIASHVAGWKTYAAVAPPAQEYSRTSRKKSVSMNDLNDPLAHDPCVLMLGGEGDGLPLNLRKNAHFRISIPVPARYSTVDSLNVSVAAGILSHFFLNQHKRSITPLVDEVDVTEDAGEKTLDDLVDVTEDVGEKTSHDLVDATEDAVEKTSDDLVDVTEDVGEKTSHDLVDATEDAVEKTSDDLVDVTEDVGEKTSHDLVDVTEDVGEKTLADLVDVTEDAGKKSSDDLF